MALKRGAIASASEGCSGGFAFKSSSVSVSKLIAAEPLRAQPCVTKKKFEVRMTNRRCQMTGDLINLVIIIFYSTSKDINTEYIK